ncbi:hypothetical protein Acr_20g0003610 [Actinidia rufa]|uniref:Transmembrane protein n=1 Tax=Actinidia rufa TaxID=165716 RepID=A0A7J0GCN6_9ERIC|nr:hypothetical protein Acr_20g0003610 [Actinidia rufa]
MYLVVGIGHRSGFGLESNTELVVPNLDGSSWSLSAVWAVVGDASVRGLNFGGLFLVRSLSLPPFLSLVVVVVVVVVVVDVGGFWVDGLWFRCRWCGGGTLGGGGVEFWVLV